MPGVVWQVEEPIALEGTVCASTDYDKRAGQCVASSHPAQAKAKVQPSKQLVAEGGAGHAHAHGTGEVEERGECPLCTFMLASPCKDVFVVFKACIDKCVRRGVWGLLGLAWWVVGEPTGCTYSARHTRHTHTGPGTRTRRRT